MTELEKFGDIDDKSEETADLILQLKYEEILLRQTELKCRDNAEARLAKFQSNLVKTLHQLLKSMGDQV